MAPASVDCTKKLHDEIEQTPAEFRPLLFQIVHSFRESVSELPSAQDSFKEGWKNVMAGNTQSIDTLWDGIDIDDKELKKIIKDLE
ncbi:MAG: hypothetical protein HRT35_38145 [Algicola sp.]|nr:hypothetical protein [Algicola sp.]